MFRNRAPDGPTKTPLPGTAAALPRQRRHAPVQILLLCLSVLLPLALFGWTAFSEHRQALQDAGQAADRTIAVLHEHAARVLETNELVLSEVMRQTEGRSWEEIGRDSRLWTYLLRVAADLGQPTDITLADGTGRVRMTTTRFPAARDDSLAGQEDFEALRGRQSWTHVAVLPETALTPRQITLSRRRVGADGSFDGILRIGLPVSQFSAFWARYAPNIRYVVTLVRSDGRVVTRWPSTPCRNGYRPAACCSAAPWCSGPDIFPGSRASTASTGLAPSARCATIRCIWSSRSKRPPFWTAGGSG